MVPEGADLSYIVPSLRPLAVPISGLVFDPRNARKHDRKNLDSIKGSLQKFGQYAPIVVQRQGAIIRAGNGRTTAALELGWEYIAAVIVDANDADAVAMAIADNWTAELAEWDYEVLLEELASLRLAEVAVPGMNDDDILALAAALPNAEEEVAKVVEQVETAGQDTMDDLGDMKPENLYVQIGDRFKWPITRAALDAWVQQVDDEVGLNPKTVRAEVLTRLRFTP